METEEVTRQNPKKNRHQLNRTGLELVIGNVIYYVIGQILILLFAKERLSISLGFGLGVLVSTLMIIHMSYALDYAMHLNETGADKHIKKTTAIRLGSCLIILILVGITGIGNILAALVGVLALKVSAYLQPFTHRVLATKSTEKGR